MRAPAGNRASGDAHLPLLDSFGRPGDRSEHQEAIAPWAATVSGGKVVGNFGEQAASLLDASLASFEAATVDVVGASALVAARGGKLRKAIANDLSSLFAKQHKLLAQQQLARYKKQLLKVVSRGGRLEEGPNPHPDPDPNPKPKPIPNPSPSPSPGPNPNP